MAKLTLTAKRVERLLSDPGRPATIKSAVCCWS